MLLLVLGERGTGKTRIVKTLVAELKRPPGKVVTLAWGGLDSPLADSLLFGQRKGGFTGAVGDRSGLLAEADDGILFLDEEVDVGDTHPLARLLERPLAAPYFMLIAFRLTSQSTDTAFVISRLRYCSRDKPS